MKQKYRNEHNIEIHANNVSRVTDFLVNEVNTIITLQFSLYSIIIIRIKTVNCTIF